MILVISVGGRRGFDSGREGGRGRGGGHWPIQAVSPARAAYGRREGGNAFAFACPLPFHVFESGSTKERPSHTPRSRYFQCPYATGPFFCGTIFNSQALRGEGSSRGLKPIQPELHSALHIWNQSTATEESLNKPLSDSGSDWSR